MRRFFRAVLLVFALSALTAPAQVLRFERMTQDDGLSQNFVNTITQDSIGFLWIGTQDGLNRFDGYEIRQFRPDGSATALQDAQIRDLVAGPDGTLWVATREGGFSLWDPKSETFRHWRHDPKREDSLRMDSVNALIPNPDGTIWVATLDGIDLFDPKRDSFRRVLKTQTNFIHRDDSGTLWVGGREGVLSSIDPRGTVSNHEQVAGPVTTMLTAGGRTWAGTASGALLTWESSTQTFTRVEGIANENAVTSLLVDRKGTLWIGTRGGGLLARDPKTLRVRQFRTDPSNPNSIPDDGVETLFEDRSGVLWVGTEVGLSRHDPSSAAFRVYRTQPEGPSDPYVWASQSDAKGNIWLGTNSGLSFFDRASNTWRSWAANPDDPKALLSDKVAAVLIDRTGAIWAGGNRGLSRYSPATDTFESWRRDGENAPLPARVFALHEARDGSIIVGTGKGLKQWDPASGTFIHLGTADDWAAVFNISEDATGDLWAGTFHNGLARLNRSRNVFERPFRFEPQQISATLVDSRGRLWIGTTQGAFRRESNNTLRQYRMRDGLPNDTVLGFVESADGAIWMSTNDGIARLDPERNTFRIWKTGDGLPSNEFNQMAVGKTPAGEILFGTPSGLVIFHPAELGIDEQAPAVVITGFEIFNAPVPVGARDGDAFSLAQSIVTTRAIELSHREKVVTFSFAALSFAAPRQIKYSYRLEGWDDAWREATPQRRSATYTNLPDGRYVFRVRASNKDGVWNEEGASISLRVLPPPWRTWWAYSLYVLLAIAAIILIVGIRVRALRQRQRELESLVQVRTAELARANQAKSIFLANMSHELRTPLNAVLGFAQLLDRSRAIQGDDRRGVETIRRAGEHLLGLINDVLSLSKIEAGRLSLEPQPFSLRNALQGVEAMMRVRADRAGLRLVFETGDLPDTLSGDEGKLRQVLMNLLGNAVKFTKQGTVTLRTSWNEGRALFEVEDTGEGIAPSELQNLFEPFVQTESGRTAKEGTGLGLAITREIVRLMDGEIRVRSEVGKGSCFSFDVAMPRLEQQAVEEAQQGRVTALAAGERRRAILVADDNPDNRLLVVRLLGGVGLSVEEAADGEEALAAWERNRPDLILMDMRMPRLDGRDATRLIRQRERERGNGRTPIVALTASAFEHERDEILACGADDFLTKPFREARLFRVVEQQTGVRFVTEEQQVSEESGVTREHIVRLSSDESKRLRDVLGSGDVEKAAEVAMAIRLRDDTLGRQLLADIREYRIDHLLDLLEAQ